MSVYVRTWLLAHSTFTVSFDLFLDKYSQMYLRTVYLYKQNMPGKTWSVTYSEYVSVALSHPACKAHEPYYIVIRGLSGYAILFHIISQKARSSKKKYLAQNVCFDFLNDFVWKIAHSKKNSAIYYHECRHVFTYSTRYSSRISMKAEFSGYDFAKYSNTKWHENPSNGSRVVLCGWTNNPKLIVIIRNFAKV